ncbi:VOC family protein [Marinibacterium profundimaris]|uniref:Polyphosphate kinase n=1 Tax=Marinibacterium profundimaris TaxID=1679460 RepID=A0A225NHT3_9RHOB|nr:VOC family protein [Marinibacterium profundimaris]OWU73002.1 polyphosphate kinase [Marinibacterium profundimaris]
MELDHIVVAGQTLEEATAHAEAALGVPFGPGGRHAAFGTHNRLLGMDDGLYLETIAIDPDAPAAGRPRWFDLDAFTGAPRLSNWVCRSDMLDDELAHLPGAGTPIAVERGDLRWRMAVPATGRLPFDNLCPALIGWQGDLHPSSMLPASGCRLKRLVVSHPEAADLSSLLDDRLSDPRVVFDTGPAGLRAEIETPNGLRILA